jgi:hypothetical protein
MLHYLSYNNESTNIVRGLLSIAEVPSCTKYDIWPHVILIFMTSSWKSSEMRDFLLKLRVLICGIGARLVIPSRPFRFTFWVQRSDVESTKTETILNIASPSTHLTTRSRCTSFPGQLLEMIRDLLLALLGEGGESAMPTFWTASTVLYLAFRTEPSNWKCQTSGRKSREIRSFRRIWLARNCTWKRIVRNATAPKYSRSRERFAWERKQKQSFPELRIWPETSRNLFEQSWKQSNRRSE